MEKNVNRRRGGFGETSEAGEGGRNGHNEKMSFVGKSLLSLDSDETEGKRWDPSEGSMRV